MASTREYLSKYIQDIWYPNSKTRVLDKIFYLILLPFSIVYFLISIFRRALYKFKVFRSYEISVPVIIIGNITVGGTGKTPVTIAIVNLLKHHGLKPGIIMRGYRNKSLNASNTLYKLNKSAPIFVSDDITTTKAGDEAVLIFNKTKCPVAVGADRVISAEKLVSNYGCNIIISDDGLQHYKLQRNIEISLLDGSRLLGNRTILPAGPLRESASRLKLVEFILCKQIDAIKQNNTKSSQQLGFSISDFRITPKQFWCLDNKNYSINDFIDYLCSIQSIQVNTGFRGQAAESSYSQKSDHKTCGQKNILALSGIANNNSFFSTLKSLGLTNIEFKGLSDHYSYSKTELLNLLNKYDKVICTEKDAVKLKEIVPQRYYKKVFYLEISAELPEDFTSEFIVKIQDLLYRYGIVTKNHNTIQNSTKSLTEEVIE